MTLAFRHYQQQQQQQQQQLDAFKGHSRTMGGRCQRLLVSALSMQRANTCSDISAPDEGKEMRKQPHQAEGWELAVRRGAVFGRVV